MGCPLRRRAVPAAKAYASYNLIQAQPSEVLLACPALRWRGQPWQLSPHEEKWAPDAKQCIMHGKCCRPKLCCSDDSTIFEPAAWDQMAYVALPVPVMATAVSYSLICPWVVHHKCNHTDAGLWPQAADTASLTCTCLPYACRCPGHSVSETRPEGIHLQHRQRWSEPAQGAVMRHRGLLVGSAQTG